MLSAMKFRIKEHRLARKWSQEHLATLAGTTKGYISQIESGKRDPSAETLRSIAAALDKDVTDMIAPETDEAKKAIEILTLFQKLLPDDRDDLLRLARRMLPEAER